EKQTYNPASSTFSAIAGFLMHKQIGTGGNMYIDDMCIYAGAVDNIAPSVPTAFTTVSVTSNSINLSWSAPLTGVDNGGYLVVRGTVDPTTAPNVNGIYAVGNSIGSGVVVYQGIGTSFTDNALTDGTT
ncbi:fibronectin type III domain-containing protein, partial [bacterium]|nr:fibronectin type III domain-containing protein [bacterium]